MSVPSQAPAPASLRTRLALQMFLQFAALGAWSPVMGRHLANLGFTPFQIGAVYSASALATILTMLLAGEIADRWVSVEKLLSLCHLCYAVLIFLAGRVTADDPARFPRMWGCVFGAMLFYGPTSALGNAISFRHLHDPPRQFHQVRVFGTFGWIAAAGAVSAWMGLAGRGIGDCFALGSAFAVADAAYCLTLPRTPPLREAPRRMALSGALGMLKDPSFALLTVLTFVLSVFTTFAYFRASEFYPTVGIRDRFLSVTLAAGQATEVLAMFLLPWFLTRLGTKATMALGMSAWVLRYGLLALGNPPALMVAAQALHGFCFALTFISAQIYVERVCPPDVRASAQGLHGLCTMGLGMFAGGYAGGFVLQKAAAGSALPWPRFWGTAAAACLAVLAAFLIGFRARDRSRTPTAAVSPPPPAPLPPSPAA